MGGKEKLEKKHGPDFKKLFVSCGAKWWLFLICGLGCAALSLVLTVLLIAPQYRATVNFYVNNTARQGVAIDADTSSRQVRTYIAIAESDAVMEEAARRLGVGYNSDGLLKLIVTGEVRGTELFSLSVTTADAAESARVANVLAEVIPNVIAEVVEGATARVINQAKLPTTRYSPSYVQNVLLGFLVGLLAAFVVVTVGFMLDVRIKDEDDLNTVAPYPVLGQIPHFSSIGDDGEKAGGYGYVYETNRKGRSEAEQ